MKLGLEGKVALVTGSTRGIGFQCALRLAEEGAAVAISGRTREALDAALEKIRATGAKAAGSVGDLLEPGATERFVDDTVGALGRLDCVVCSLGGTSGGNFLETSDDDWLKTFSANTLAAVRTARAAVPHLTRAGGGSIVVIASISGSRPGPRSQYGAAKAAEIQWARSVARELAERRIRVNTVSPGSILFPGGSWERRLAERPAQMAEFISREFPFGRLGTLDEVADVVTFLSSPRASWISGADVVVDGAQGQPSIRL